MNRKSILAYCLLVALLGSHLNSAVAQSASYVPLNFNAGSFQKEPLGPASRRSGLIISEIMYHPAPNANGYNLEFIELYNTDAWAVNLSGHRISGAVDFTFPDNTTVASHGFLVVAHDPVAVAQVYKISNVVGGYTNSLLNSSGNVRLRHPSGAILVEAQFSANPPWPVAADGGGHSLQLAHASYGEDDPRAWSASEQVGGSPGQGEPTLGDPYRTLLINEFLAHTDAPDGDYVELFNYSSNSVDVSSCIIAEYPTTNQFKIPANTVIPALGFVVFTQTQLGFSLNPAGDTLYLFNPPRSRVIDAVKFGPQAKNLSYGRYPDGAPALGLLSIQTPGATNAVPLVNDIVINEIMYHPLSGDSNDEYVELYNRGAKGVDLSRWRFTEGIDYRFPNGAYIPAGGYVVVAKNAAHLMTNYAQLNGNNTVGNFQGNLANSGEHLALAKPEPLVSTNNQIIETNRMYVVVEEVTFGQGGRWGQWADGGGSSLELVDAHSNHRWAANWADSDESGKTGWVTIEHRGVLDLGVSSFSGDSLHLFLEGEGECLVDNVEVIGPSGNNLVSNGDFSNTSAALETMGTHDYSTIDSSGGVNNSPCLHLRATGRGDTGANRVRLPMSSALNSGTTATLRAKVRWLKGNPEILLRLHGNWLEAAGNIVSNPHLGSPGAANSRTQLNLGPAIAQVTHYPVLPTANQPVTVIAQLDDPDGLSSVVVKYRVDPNASYSSVPMTYRGAGYYSAIIPGQAANTMVAFYLQAQDNAAAPVSSRFPADAPSRECLILFGQTQPANSFPTYRIWITQATNNRWINREKTSNEPLDATFAYGNLRAVYDAQTQYKGSPFIVTSYSGPTGGLCGYAVDFPPDDRVLGSPSIVLDYFPRDGSKIREQLANWILEQLGSPFSRRAYVNLYVNAVKRGDVYEDAQQPNSDYVESWFHEDTDGGLYKLDDGFEFNDATTSFQRDNGDTAATVENFTTTGGVKKTARYRWHWRKRAVNGSANDYQDLFDLVDAMNAPATNYTRAVEALVDVDSWLRSFCGERIVGNWDSYGYRRGKNMFAYKPQNGLWKMLPWDIDFVLGSGDGTTQDFFSGADPRITTFYNHPPFKRNYYRVLKEATEGPLFSANVDPVIDSHYQALVNNSVPASDERATIKSWISQRRNFILGLLSQVAATFSITSNSGRDFTTAQNLVVLEGTAPVEICTIKVNGQSQPITWTGVTQWQIRVALKAGANALLLEGFDRYDQLVPTATANQIITYTGNAESPVGRVAINEIMYHQGATDAEYLELYNASTTIAFDLSSWRLEGADFTFPPGALIRPQEYLVLAKNRSVFTSMYGVKVPVYGEFDGNLDNGGETLSLVKPGATPDQDVIVDRVHYDNNPPWPLEADGMGYSLQLIDPAQNHNRVGNWAVGSRPGGTNQGPQWTYVSVTGTASSSRLYIYLTTAGEVYLDDLQIVAGTQAGQGANQVINGDFEQAMEGTWTVSANHAQSALTTAVKHAGNSCLHVVATTGGSTQGSSIWQDMLTMVNNATYTLSFWYLPGTNTTSLTLRLSGNGINQLVAVQPPGQGASQDYPLGTPGTANSVRAVLAPFPALYLNEVEPENLSGLSDQTGQPLPWIELYNAETNRLNLTGFYLANNYGNLAQWAFPTDTWIESKSFLVVWADETFLEPPPGELHANFIPTPNTGSVALSRQVANQYKLVDYLNYKNVSPDRSFGSYPDGQSFDRQLFHYPTPGNTNNNALAPLQVVINEWMGNNTHTLADPVDEVFHDWIELYNASTNNAELTGYTLIDSLTNKTGWTFPPGTVLPPNSYLLIWADGDNRHANITNTTDLHADFALNQAGDAIGLFAPDGTAVDVVSFTNQAPDVSSGRWPDGHLAPLPIPTPRAVNQIPLPANSPPVLPLELPKTINEGETLAFQVVAQDYDVPSQVITFSLNTNAPVGASISTNGQFTWTPTEAEGPGLYLIEVMATDNGTPSLSATQEITITVNEVNLPPVLSPIPDLSARIGQTLVYTNQALDNDWPTNTLTYHLEEDAPAGATIDPDTGVFSWTPDTSQGPRTWSLTVTVNDHGAPAMSDSKSMLITVLGPPTAPHFTGIQLDNTGPIKLQWDSEPGAHYRVQYKADLADPQWLDVSADLEATGTILEFADERPTKQQGFYQILRIETR
jgi:hypothetical protein